MLTRILKKITTSVTVKLNLIISALFICVILLMSFLTYSISKHIILQFYKDTGRDTIQRTATQIVEKASQANHRSDLLAQPEFQKEILDDFSKVSMVSDIVGMSIFNVDHQPVFQVGEKIGQMLIAFKNPSELKEGVSIRIAGTTHLLFFQELVIEKPNVTHDDLFFYGEAEKEAKGTPIGGLTLLISLENFDRKVSRLLLFSFGIAFFFIIFAIGLHGYFLKRIMEPIKKMTTATARLAAGAYDYRLNSQQKDELGQLANAFDLMAGELEQKIRYIGAQEEKYRRIFESILDVYIEVSLPERKVLEVSPSITQNSGYTREELLGVSIIDFIATRNDHNQLMEAIKNNGSVRDFEVSLFHKDGRIVPCSYSAKISSDENGVPTRILGTLRDITERKRTEQELTKHRNQLDQLVAERTAELNRLGLAIRYSPVPICITDLNGNIQSFNPAFRAMSGYSEKEILGANPRILKSDKQNVEFYRDLWTTILSGKSWRGELINKRKNGELFPAILWISPVMGDNNEITHFISIIEDITERLQAEEMRRKAERLQSIESGRAQLSAMVLHNIGNAVTPVVVHLSRLQNDQLTQLTEYFEKSWSALKKHEQMLTEYVNADKKGKQVFAFLGQLVEALKEYDRETKANIIKMDSAMTYISESISLQQQYAAQNNEVRQLTNINQIMIDALRMQTVSLEKRGIAVSKQLAENLPELIIERNKLMQVVVNFIKNSFEAIDENKDALNGKSITVKTFLADKRIGFEIMDTGIGVEPTEIDNLFEFGKSRKGSTGVGLYYCKTFIEGNGGTLKMLSAGIGKGATIRVVF